MSMIVGGFLGITLPDNSNIPSSNVTVEFSPYIRNTANVMTVNNNVRFSGSNGVTTPLGTISENPFSFFISTNTTNVNLRTSALAAGWNGTAKVKATINTGVTIYSTSTGSYALTINGSFPQGVELTNNGTILGRGGDGNGGTGGPALLVQTVTTINNQNGRIAGGGGAGGVGGSTFIPSPYDGTLRGGGGGGGIGNGAGGPQGAGDNNGAVSAGSAGSSGTLTTAGSGGAGAYGVIVDFCRCPPSTYYYAGAGGNGGSYGSSGSAGVGGGAGGAGGASLVGNSNITWIATGIRNGSIS